MVDLKQLMFDKGLKQSDLAAILDISQSLVSKVIRGERGVPAYYMDKLTAHFGESVIKKYTRPSTPIVPTMQQATVTIFDAETIEEIRAEVKEEEIKKTIVLTPDIIRNPDIDIRAELKAGNLDEYAKPTQDTLPTHTAKVYSYCDDMEPEIRAGEPVLVQLLPSGTAIMPGQMYFVDLPSGSVIRYIEKEEEGKLYLKARNSNYGDIIIKRSDVQSLSLVRMILRSPRSMNNRESTLSEMMTRKDDHLSNLLATNNKLIDEVVKQNERTDELVNKILNN